MNTQDEDDYPIFPLVGMFLLGVGLIIYKFM